MTMRELTCSGLDGTDPLTMLASYGVLSLGSRAGLIRAMGWRPSPRWHAAFLVRGSRGDLIDALLEAIAGRDTDEARRALDALSARMEETRHELDQAQATLLKATDPTHVRKIKTKIKSLRATTSELKAASREAEITWEAHAKAGVSLRHAVTTRALHLDDVGSRGLSRADFVSLAREPGAMPYLHGLACDADLAVKKKSVIARTHLSFANGGSGKMLIKDFAAVAKFTSRTRIEDALFGDGTLRDPITGLGWDPSSQRSYALQFADPQDDVHCQTMHHALGFIGLACFPVVPYGVDRATVGVHTQRREVRQASEADEEDEGNRRDTSRPIDYLTWPLWLSLISPDVVRALLARRELTQSPPPLAAYRASGIAAVFRSRRFSLSKRSYFAPPEVVL